MDQKDGRVLPVMLLLAAWLAVSASPAPAQDLSSDQSLRRTVEGNPSSSRLADPNADLIEALGAYNRQDITAPGEKGDDPSQLRQVADPAAEDAADPGPDAGAPGTRPRQSFDLDDGPPSLVPGDGLSMPAGRANTSASPAARAGEERRGDGEAADDGEAAPSESQGDDLPDPLNPALGAGVTDETRGVQSILRSNQAAETVDRVRRLNRADADDPFAPIGVRVGTFILYPELIQTIGASSNLQNERDATSGAFTETILSSRLVSDWSSHQAEFNSRFSYRKDFAGDEQQDPSAAVDGRLRLDISRDTVATLRGAIDFAREDYSDVLDDESLSGRADVFSGSLAAELTHDFHPVSVGGTLTAARRSYLSLPEGSVDEDYTTLSAALRTGFDLSPAIKPFVEASLGRRLFDVPQPSERDGPSRDAWLPALRTGVALDLRDKLKGEIAVGYAWYLPDDEAARTASATTLDASLVWSPQRGTDVTLAALTSFAPELTGQSATTNYETSLAIAHSVGARTTLTAAARLGYEDSTIENDDKLLLSGEAGFNYWLNRQFALTGSYEHRRSFAVAEDSRYSADTIRLGITLQR